ncbi:meprin A subunit beta-like [Xyrichtys novacula]|uniref:Metalloendopeptidase n=1 Tax=Xyrichtys novacula TaxID=13765 RepID=A0AAV1FNW1_XYRNO|nr:meprin A subunit beta-like [Xyrichtys novacula]
MKSFIFLVVSLAVSSAIPPNKKGPEIVEIGVEKSIDEINKDSGHDDILETPNIQRSSTNNDDILWPSPVPYVLDSSLDANAKGVILKAFDQFRLKSCIDFRERDSEDYYINAKKLDGCFSYIGRVIAGGQDLSIGQYCDEISTIEHEYLHALGFNHEQSRYDRDDHVTIIYKNILQGFESNFDKASKAESTTNGLRYDYDSVMHYGKDAFSNGNGSTIITIDPKFQDVIGQRLQMSPTDVQELNLRYQCNSTIAFQFYCGFTDGDACQMSSCSQGGIEWEKSSRVAAGPVSDHTNLPGQKNSYFMHASTASGQEEDSAWLETKRITPKRDCNVQCLQFYYYHSGSESDELNIWIREFEDQFDVRGTVRLMGQISGQPKSYWQIKHISLNATKDFQVVFEARKGAGNSRGGFSIDDINLSELECPHVTLQFDNFENLLNTSAYGTQLFSPRQYSRGGYAYTVGVVLYETFIGMVVRMVSGENDDELEWPVPNRQVTFGMVDQTPNIQIHMTKQRSITSDRSVNSEGKLNWGDPSEVGTPSVNENNETTYAGPLLGRYYFADFEDIKSRQYLKGGSAVFSFTFQDLTPLVNGNTLPCPELRPVQMRQATAQLNGPCFSGTPPPLPKTTDDHMIHPTSGWPPLKTTDDMIHPTTDWPPLKTTDDHMTYPPFPQTTDDDKINPSTYRPPRTTEDDSLFGFAPGLASCPVLTFLLALMLLIR